ncbi:MAG: hypothetical protein ACRDF4_08205 [Rhabdochlamydiaceae bacterium]
MKSTSELKVRQISWPTFRMDARLHEPITRITSKSLVCGVWGGDQAEGSGGASPLAL